jgi:hypothetical protein
MSLPQIVYVSSEYYLFLKGLLVINGFKGHIVNFVRNLIWNYHCLSDYPHDGDVGKFRFPNSEHTISRSGSEQLVYTTRYNVLLPHCETYHLRSSHCTSLRWLVIPSTIVSRDTVITPKPTLSHLKDS